MQQAMRLAVSTFGTITAVAAIEHGIGEVIQGNVRPNGIVIASWPNSAFFRIVAGEPAMTIIPNLLLSGLLTILIALIFLVWVTLFVVHKQGGLITILLSLVLLFVGGGFGPPILGIIIGSAATRINAPSTWWTQRAPAWLRDSLAATWPWILALSVAAWLFLFPGLNLLSFYAGLDNDAVVMATIVVAFGTLLLTLAAASAYDSKTRLAPGLSSARGGQ